MFLTGRNKKVFNINRIQSTYINEIITSIGLMFTDDELLEMVQEADINGDQHISFDEFRDIFNEG